MIFGLIWLLIVAAAETLLMLAVCALPDKWHWKMYLAVMMIAVAVGIAAFVSVNFKREIRSGDAANAVACDRAQTLLAAGKRQELKDALTLAQIQDYYDKDYATAAEFFRQTVDNKGAIYD